MYKCLKCKKFAKIGPGQCWKCGADLVKEEEAPKQSGPLVLRLRGDESSNQPKQPEPLVLRLRRPKQILFVGVIDGGPELEFLKLITWPDCIAFLASYGKADPKLLELNNRTFRLSGQERRVTICARENVDGTKLHTIYAPQTFDAVVWIGPTWDGNLPNTPKLVGAFVTSAGKVLVDGGVVFVMQDLKAPNFRGIITLPGAFFCCEMSLQGRTQTQHSSTKKVLEDRRDHLIAFTFLNGGVVQLQTDNDKFEQIFSMIMSSKQWAPKEIKFKSGKVLKPHSKKEIAELIFGFAKNL